MGFEFSSDEGEYPTGMSRLPEISYDPSIFFAEAAEEDGESDPLTVRVSHQVTRHLDEMVITLKQMGLPVKTRSDLLRYFVKAGIISMVDNLESPSPDAHVWAQVQRNLGRQTMNSVAALTARQQVAGSIQGWKRQVELGEFDQAHGEIDRFIRTFTFPFVGGDNEHLARMYRRELFGNSIFQELLVSIVGQRGQVSDIIQSSGERYREDVART